MASIPWEYLFFYMSPAEYNRMKNYPGTFAKSASVRIRTWNTRVAFQTGDTQTANASLNQNKFLQVAKGIRSIPFICSTNRKYTYSDTEPPTYGIRKFDILPIPRWSQDCYVWLR